MCEQVEGEMEMVFMIMTGTKIGTTGVGIVGVAAIAEIWTGTGTGITMT